MAFQKDPDAVLDYTVDWAEWLGNDLIDTSVWIVEDGITVTDDTNTTTTATVWLSGGTDGRTYRATNRITTAAGRTDDRDIVIFCRGGLSA